MSTMNEAVESVLASPRINMTPAQLVDLVTATLATEGEPLAAAFDALDEADAMHLCHSLQSSFAMAASDGDERIAAAREEAIEHAARVVATRNVANYTPDELAAEVRGCVSERATPLADANRSLTAERDEFERRMLQSELVAFDMAVAENARLSAHEATIRDLRADLATAASVAAELRADFAEADGHIAECQVWLHEHGVENSGDGDLRPGMAELVNRADDLRARNEELVAALEHLLGVGHNLKAFAGTMLRWKDQPGVDWSDEAARIVRLAEESHATICAALSKNRGTR